jgi:hypothetical protein
MFMLSERSNDLKSVKLICNCHFFKANGCESAVLCHLTWTVAEDVTRKSRGSALAAVKINAMKQWHPWLHIRRSIRLNRLRSSGEACRVRDYQKWLGHIIEPTRSHAYCYAEFALGSDTMIKYSYYTNSQ